MDWKDVGKKIATAGAPILGGALLGPFGAAAGALLANELGVADTTPEGVDAAISSMPGSLEQREALLTIQTKHVEVLRAMDIDELRVRTADVQDARHTHKDHWMPWALTVALLVMTSALTAVLCMVEVPVSNKEVVYFLAGQIVTAFLAAVTYWLGTSKGSADKQRMIESRL